MKLEDEIVQHHFKNGRQKTIINIFFTHSWLYEKHIQHFKPYGITVQQYNILRILRGQHPKPATIKLLKDRMLDKMPDVSRLVEKLRVKGLVERTSCSKDRRNVDVLITQKGLDLLTSMEGTEDSLSNLMASLTDTELEKLNEFLDKVRG